MTSVLSALTTATVGAVFGLVLASPPGPMNAVIAEESVLRGWTAGFKAGLGAMFADVLFFVLTLLGIATLIDGTDWVRALLYVAGGVLMLYFAFGAYRDARAAGSFTGDVSHESTGFRKAFALSLTNPYQIGFWITVGVGLLTPGQLDVLKHVPLVGERLAGTLIVQTGSIALLGGFFAGIPIWIVVYPGGLVRVGRRIDAFAPIIAGLSGVVLAGFGLVFLWVGAAGLL